MRYVIWAVVDSDIYKCNYCKLLAKSLVMGQQCGSSLILTTGILLAGVFLINEHPGFLDGAYKAVTRASLPHHFPALTGITSFPAAPSHAASLNFTTRLTRRTRKT